MLVITLYVLYYISIYTHMSILRHNAVLTNLIEKNHELLLLPEAP